MRFQIVPIVCTLLGLAACLPLEEGHIQVAARNSALEQAVLDALESLRVIMLQGSDTIPVLDPLQVDYLHLDLEPLIGIQNSHVAISAAIVRQLSTFVVDDLSIRMTSLILQRYAFEMEGHVPSVESEVDNYNMDVTYMNVNVFGNGNVKVKIVEPRVKISMEIGISISISSGISVVIRSSRVQLFLTGFDTKITGVFGGDEFIDDFSSVFISNLIPELVEFFEPEITQTLSDIVMTIGNDILANLDLSDILGRNAILQHLQPLEKTVDDGGDLTK